MNENFNNKEYELICFIVNFGVGSKVVKLARQCGVTGGTIFLGHGTVNNRILKLLDLTDIRKEVVYMLSERETASKTLQELNKKLALHKPNHGIAFTSSIKGIFGTRCYRCDEIGDNTDERRGVENAMYNAIYAIVDRGKGEDVIDAATKAGSRGGTVINARGSGIHETHRVFSMSIEPEKEIVLILSENKTTAPIVKSIREQLQMDKPGNGIIFVQAVTETHGLYDS